MSQAYLTIASSLQSAHTRAALINAAQNIQHVADIIERDRLGAIVKRRLTEFKHQ